MREFKKHRTKKEELVHFVLRGAGILVLFFVTAVLLRAAWGMYVKMAAASEGQEEAEVTLAQAQAQQRDMDQSLSELASQRGQETEIRQLFGVAKPGEGEIDIVRDQTSSSTAEGAGESWWQHLWHALVVW